MQIRKANLNDMNGLMDLVSHVVPVMPASGNLQWGDDYPNVEVFTSDIAKEQLWIAEIKNELTKSKKIAGVAAITTDQDPEYAQIGWDLNELSIVVHRLAVHPAFQGTGVAKKLMEQAEVVARSKQISILKVDTNTQNAVTQKLFPSLGYSEVGEIVLNLRPGLLFKCYEKRLILLGVE